MNHESEELSSALEQARILDKDMLKLLGDKYYGFTTERVLEPINFIPTGCYSLDKVLGGGIPLGRVIECFGRESTGKSLLMQTIAAQFQKRGLLTAIIDSENALDPEFAKYLGLDLSKAAIITQPESLEEVLEACRTIVKSGAVSFLAVDSVCGVPPLGIQERKVGEDTMALAARLLSRHIPELAKEAAKNNCSLFFINQIRASLKMYGAPEVTPGGNALLFTSSIRIKISKKEILKASGQEIGYIMEVKGIKNKCGKPFVAKEMTLLFPHLDSDGVVRAGIDTVSDIIKEAIERDLIQKKGSWYSYQDLKAQGEEGLKTVLTPEHLEELMNQLKEDI